MSYVRKKKFLKENFKGMRRSGKEDWHFYQYYYEVRSKRYGDNVKQLHIRYLGKTPYGSSIGATRRGIFNQQITHTKNENGTEIWIETGVKDDLKKIVSESYQDICTTGQRHSIELLEVYESDNPTYRYHGSSGYKDISIAGTYQEKEKRIRLFKQPAFKEKIDDLMAHESAHDTYFRLYTEAKKYYEDNDKYKKKMMQDYYRIKDRAHKEFEKYWAMEKDDTISKEEKQKQWKIANRWKDKQDTLDDKVHKPQSLDSDQDKYLAYRLWQEFKEASWKEGGITEYARSYQVIMHENFITENLAESFEEFRYHNSVVALESNRIYRMGHILDFDENTGESTFATKRYELTDDIKFLRDQYRKTYEAYKKILAWDSQGNPGPKKISGERSPG